MRKNTAPDAEFYVNSTEPISLEENIQRNIEGVDGLESYGFENPVFAHVQTADGVDWALFWGAWVGTFNDNTTTIPVHLVSRIVDGKVVEQHGFWNQPDPNPDMATNN